VPDISMLSALRIREGPLGWIVVGPERNGRHDWLGGTACRLSAGEVEIKSTEALARRAVLSIR